jgi:hypothetical protein
VESLVFWLVFWLVVGTIFGAFGAWIAVQKRREPVEGLVLGALFGPLGCLVEAVLPAKERKGRRSPDRGRDRVAWMPEYRPDWDKAPEPKKADADEDAALRYLNDEPGRELRK